MTNRLAIILGITLAAIIAADLVLSGGETLLFLARKLFLMIDYVAFWR